MKNYVEMNHCVEMNTQTNWLINTSFNVDCRILRIVEFDLKLLDCSKSLLNENELQNQFKLQYSNTASWLKIQVDSIFTEQPVLF